ncbi:hypothetical protein [Akkermansia glycaniphila]|uniref:Uncharacterized protein n=1 Tax=Akkermansia glycaniphila TaxID=1679444 RepID=A0A1C7P9D5_9BACT|nr:hypothetical protein [Akkermansia glycaniphila]OCA02183.1 hypothetical protein AC781_11530 [Akkermansia glycaniphila]SEH99440.1 Hypothetical protein PYTT_2393 [Akkermansia glycaniphila]
MNDKMIIELTKEMYAELEEAGRITLLAGCRLHELERVEDGCVFWANGERCRIVAEDEEVCGMVKVKFVKNQPA